LQQTMVLQERNVEKAATGEIRKSTKIEI